MGRNNDINVKDNESSKKDNVNDNAFAGAYSRYKKANEQTKDRKKYTRSPSARIRRAQATAEQLIRKFGPRSKNCYRYFCKCAYNLPESTIWNIYESSHRAGIGNSLAYFLAATKAQPQMA